ncbi:RILP-like protein 1 isoform X2 [Tachypleus tridentatus]|uniref:RILP-like protein 1 isoform X2 n=1 Tax=Tachypleus tridentatus TaxID=6853 RepID=UPI003FD0968D
MNSVVERLCVEDVYDLASEIGKEFEKIIDVYGAEVITSLMPKVICALEQLESCAVRNDRVDLEISDLNSAIAQLQYEKIEKQESKSKLEKELEHIEDIWREETNQLSELVSKLKEENFRLSSSLKEKEIFLSEKSTSCFPDQELMVAQKLKEIVDRQREQLDQKDRELHQKCNDIESLQQQVQKLVHLNKDLRRKQKHQQSQMRAFVEEKAELQVRVEEHQKELQQLRERLGTAVKENLELAQAESELVPDLRGKMVIDLDDPNRPRFTIDELKRIMFERNDLKARISELEDELSLFRPTHPPKSDNEGELERTIEELPVQGPINKEPEEKLFPWMKPSGIRRFFPSLSWPSLKFQ